MNKNRLFLAGASTLVLLFATSGSMSLPRGDKENESHVAWVAKCLKEMESLKVGATRKEAEKLFTFEGGLTFPGRGHYVSRKCPYFKLDVEYEVGRDKDGRSIESPNDKITKVLTPYLGWTTAD